MIEFKVIAHTPQEAMWLSEMLGKYAEKQLEVQKQVELQMQKERESVIGKLYNAQCENPGMLMRGIKGNNEIS